MLVCASNSGVKRETKSVSWIYPIRLRHKQAKTIQEGPRKEWGNYNKRENESRPAVCRQKSSAVNWRRYDHKSNARGGESKPTERQWSEGIGQKTVAIGGSCWRCPPSWLSTRPNEGVCQCTVQPRHSISRTQNGCQCHTAEKAMIFYCSFVGKIFKFLWK